MPMKDRNEKQDSPVKIKRKFQPRNCVRASPITGPNPNPMEKLDAMTDIALHLRSTGYTGRKAPCPVPEEA
jgi:hypothetical protein